MAVSGLEEVILSLLVQKQGETHEHELYGLEMVKKSSGKLKRGTVYVTLQRMQDNGLVESREEDRRATRSHRRRLYRATELGRRALEAAEAYRKVMSG